MKKHQAGFTLIETLAVVAMIGTLCSICVLQFQTANDNYRLERYTRELAADIAWLQRRTMNGGLGASDEPWRIVIDGDGKGYSIIDRHGAKEGVVRSVALQDEGKIKLLVEETDGKAAIGITKKIAFHRDWNGAGYRAKLSNSRGQSKYIHVAFGSGRVRISDKADFAQGDGG